MGSPQLTETPKEWPTPASNQATLTAVAEALSRLRYGAVHLTVHDGKVVQLDVTDRRRFT
jgi:hypothetical protein